MTLTGCQGLTWSRFNGLEQPDEEALKPLRWDWCLGRPRQNDPGKLATVARLRKETILPLKSSAARVPPFVSSTSIRTPRWRCARADAVCVRQ